MMNAYLCLALSVLTLLACGCRTPDRKPDGSILVRDVVTWQPIRHPVTKEYVYRFPSETDSDVKDALQTDLKVFNLKQEIKGLLDDYLATLQVHKELFEASLLSVQGTNHRSDIEQQLQLINVNIRTLQDRKQRIGQQSAAPLPSAPAGPSEGAR